MAFEDEEDVTGAIDTGEDNSGMGPVAEASQAAPDNSGMGPVVPTAESLAPSPRTRSRDVVDHIVDAGKMTPAEGIKQFPGNAKRIVSYLMGEGAVDPQTLERAGTEVDPDGRMSPDDRNLLAVQAANDKAGPEAAWKLVQANRVAYNAKQAFAYAALNGTPQKPPDLRAAVQAANQAAGHVLDGSNVQFAPAEGGVTATVNRPGSQPEQYQLSLDAFRKYLNVGGDGQWDRVMQTTVPKTLAALSQDKGQGAPGRGATRMDQLRPLQKAPPQDNSESDAYTPPAPTTNFGKTPSTLNLSGSDEITRTPTAVEETNYGSELEARARRMFPSISQEEERNRWMATEEQRQEGAQNRVDVARAGAEGKVQAAQATGQSRENVAKTNAAGHVATQQEKNKGWQYASDTKLKAAQAQLGQRIREMEARNANNDQTRALKAIQTKMLSLQALTPEEQKYLDTLPGAGTAGAAVNAPNAGSRQPAPRPQGGSQQPPVQGAKLYKGKWYTRGPNGESVPVE